MKIIGLCLVKNEEIFIRTVILNIIAFCDKIIIADNLSKDNTWEIINKLAKSHKNIECVSLKNVKDSQRLIQNYAGSKTWVFAVDGDEVYDPVGLRNMRILLSSGAYDQYTHIFGNVLNCINIDFNSGVAKGYLSPPCRSMTKLYNFSLIEDCSDPGLERLHGNIIYKSGYEGGRPLDLNKIYSWGDSPFRCLHVCFLPRSNFEGEKNHKNNSYFARLNITELNNKGFGFWLGLVGNIILRRKILSNYKIDKYGRGKVVKQNVQQFFNLG